MKHKHLHKHLMELISPGEVSLTKLITGNPEYSPELDKKKRFYLVFEHPLIEHHYKKIKDEEPQKSLSTILDGSRVGYVLENKNHAKRFVDKILRKKNEFSQADIEVLYAINELSQNDSQDSQISFEQLEQKLSGIRTYVPNGYMDYSVGMGDSFNKKQNSPGKQIQEFPSLLDVRALGIITQEEYNYVRREVTEELDWKNIDIEGEVQFRNVSFNWQNRNIRAVVSGKEFKYSMNATNHNHRYSVRLFS
ncbi:hypothetical protein GF327_00670 [Candidatus Woesearchaeota archaeon]|nr:hypothetical protein [Candidatus Woesearchaeota archaeon]